jgi:glutamine amidotransferase
MIALIDYGSGNIESVANALNDLNVKYVVTSNEKEILDSEKIIFPGVGEASYAMRRLHLLNLSTFLEITRKPLLGICLGMQLLCERSVEGNVSCLGRFPVTVELFDNTQTKVPHMGWNQVDVIKETKLFSGIPDKTFFYFANSYYVPLNPYTTAQTNHGILFSASCERDNYYGVQFHPEKSGPAGIQLIKNFIELC